MNASEYSYFYDTYKDVLPGKKQVISYEDGRSLLSFDFLFSFTRLPAAFTLVKRGLLTQFKQDWKFDEPEQLLNYLRWSFFEWGLGGLVKERTVQELTMDGYSDWVLNYMKTQNPQDGGNPSYNDIVCLGDRNFTKEESNNLQQIYTGAGNSLDKIH